MEYNREAGQNPQRVVAPCEERRRRMAAVLCKFTTEGLKLKIRMD